jgi:hypothetical protein
VRELLDAAVSQYRALGADAWAKHTVSAKE